MPAIERRIGLLFLAFCALLVLAGLRALQLGGLKGGSLREKADTQQVSQVPVPARRGTITDRKGVELAVSEPADDIAVTPYLIKDPAGAARSAVAAERDAVPQWGRPIGLPPRGVQPRVLIGTVGLRPPFAGRA